ncbi:lipoprotein [Psychrobacter frigidicola]|uniref:Lipoprotein n=2 Tax=Psychrobacter frigidicola TaxID=45611 RepID=A0A5C7A3R9_9GAMM|nr:lipoprotein [Psychrobacter frigidicola]
MSSSDKPQVITINARYRLIGIFVLGATVMIGISGCGQKGALYLADTDSQMVTSSSDMLDSTSNPQDAAFAGIDDDEYQKTRYLEQKQVLPDVSDDPNDY